MKANYSIRSEILHLRIGLAAALVIKRMLSFTGAQ